MFQFLFFPDDINKRGEPRTDVSVGIRESVVQVHVEDATVSSIATVTTDKRGSIAERPGHLLRFKVPA